MKKWLTKIVAIVACATVAVFCLTACNKGDEGNKNPLVGTYKLQYLEYRSGEVYQLGTVFYGTVLTSETVVVKLKANGEASIFAEGQGFGYTWEVNASDETKIDFLMEEQIMMTASIVENVMALDLFNVGTVYYLRKV